MLRITRVYAGDRLVLKLEGRFCGPWVKELDTCWQALTETSDEPIWVDLSDVSLVDAAGEEQLARMYRAGARLQARGCAMRELVRDIAMCR